MIVEVKPYDPHWVTAYKKEKKMLGYSLGEIVSKIHHIGSTSVKGLASKPVIDILIEVKDIQALDNFSQTFEDLGYEVMGEFGIAGRRYYRKGLKYRTHQIHAFKIGDPHILRHLAFRDYLSAHPNIMYEYEKLKIELAQICKHNINLYCDGKDSFIKFHEQKALTWASRTQ